MTYRLTPARTDKSYLYCQLTSELLYQKYIVGGESVAELSREFRCCTKTIRNLLKRFNIPIRNNSESKRGEKNHNWKGGETIDKDGHVLVKSSSHPRANKNGYVLRSRLVMEKILGRYLDPGEIVHHKNKSVADDHPENLKYFPSQSEHISFHHKERKNK